MRDTLSRIQLQLSEISQQRDALQAQLESREAEFAREKALLEDLLTDVQGADKRAQESQVAVQQELLSEAQRTRVKQWFLGILKSGLTNSFAGSASEVSRSLNRPCRYSPGAGQHPTRARGGQRVHQEVRSEC